MNYTLTHKDSADEIFTHKEMCFEVIDRVFGVKSVSHYRKKTIESGLVTEVEVYPTWNTNANSRRLKKFRVTRASQERLNKRNSVKNLIRLINTNFTDDDIWGTNTYEESKLPKTVENAQKDMKNYFRRLKHHAKKHGYPPLKYVYVTEFEEGKIRLNHHYVTNFPDRDLAEKLWKGGSRTQTRRLQADDSGYEGLVRYITKDPKGAKRYVTSQNLVKPIVTINDTKITKKQVNQIIMNELSIASLMQKIYRDHEYIDGEVRYSEIVDGTYIYAKLKRRKE